MKRTKNGAMAGSMAEREREREVVAARLGLFKKCLKQVPEKKQHNRSGQDTIRPPGIGWKKHTHENGLEQG